MQAVLAAAPLAVACFLLAIGLSTVRAALIALVTAVVLAATPPSSASAFRSLRAEILPALPELAALSGIGNGVNGRSDSTGVARDRLGVTPPPWSW